MTILHKTRLIAAITTLFTASIANAGNSDASDAASAKSGVDAGTDKGVSKLVDRPSTSGAGTVKTATSGAPGVNNLPAADAAASSGSSSLENPNPPVMPSNTSGGPGLVGAPHTGVPGTGRTDDDKKGSNWSEKVIQK